MPKIKNLPTLPFKFSDDPAVCARELADTELIRYPLIAVNTMTKALEARTVPSDKTVRTPAFAGGDYFFNFTNVAWQLEYYKELLKEYEFRFNKVHPAAVLLMHTEVATNKVIKSKTLRYLGRALLRPSLLNFDKVVTYDSKVKDSVKVNAAKVSIHETHKYNYIQHSLSVTMTKREAPAWHMKYLLLRAKSVGITERHLEEVAEAIIAENEF